MTASPEHHKTPELSNREKCEGILRMTMTLHREHGMSVDEAREDICKNLGITDTGYQYAMGRALLGRSR